MRCFAPALVALSLLLSRHALAQEVSLVGMMGSKALLMVGGTPPKTLAPGESHMGVKLLSVEGEKATVELEGKRLSLRMGEAPARVGNGGGVPEGSRIVLTAGSGGHFCLLYTSPSPRDTERSRMPSSA